MQHLAAFDMVLLGFVSKNNVDVPLNIMWFHVGFGGDSIDDLPCDLTSNGSTALD